MAAQRAIGTLCAARDISSSVMKSLNPFGNGNITLRHTALLILTCASFGASQAAPPLSGLTNLRMNFVYFDLETERLAEEVGGWSNIEQLGLAVAVTMHSRDDSFHVYRANESAALLDDLRTADCVVGFNSRGFDMRVLQPYVDFNLKQLNDLDLMLDIKRAAGFRVGLNNACKATLGERKSGHGTDSVQWWREGRHEEVIAYCKQDVLLTRRLHEYGAIHHQVFCTDKQGRRRAVPVTWSLTATPATPVQGTLF